MNIFFFSHRKRPILPGHIRSSTVIPCTDLSRRSIRVVVVGSLLPVVCARGNPHRRYNKPLDKQRERAGDSQKGANSSPYSARIYLCRAVLFIPHIWNERYCKSRQQQRAQTGRARFQSPYYVEPNVLGTGRKRRSNERPKEIPAGDKLEKSET